MSEVVKDPNVSASQPIGDLAKIVANDITYVLPAFKSWTEEYKDDVKTLVTENGFDIDVIVRKNKVIINASYVVNAGWVRKFAKMHDEPEITLIKYNLLGRYDEPAEISCRMKNFKVKLLSGSQLLSNMSGVWEVSFVLEEF